MKPTELLDKDGKSLPASWQKTIGKLVLLGLIKSEYDSEQKTEVMQNPFSGSQTMMSPLCNDLCKWITRTNPISSPLLGKTGTMHDT